MLEDKITKEQVLILAKYIKLTASFDDNGTILERYEDMDIIIKFIEGLED